MDPYKTTLADWGDSVDRDTFRSEGWNFGMHHDRYTEDELLLVPVSCREDWKRGFEAALDWRQQGARR